MKLQCRISKQVQCATGILEYHLVNWRFNSKICINRPAQINVQHLKLKLFGVCGWRTSHAICPKSEDMQVLRIFDFKLNSNKKVLLRERKRHAARRVGSACYAALSPDWGYPIQSLTGGLPHVVLTWDGGTLHPDLGWVPPSKPGNGVPPRPHLGWGNPLPHQQDGGTPLPQV